MVGSASLILTDLERSPRYAPLQEGFDDRCYWFDSGLHSCYSAVNMDRCYDGLL